MVVIHPLKIAYQNIPKVGTTSLFFWFYEILFNKIYETQKKPRVHGYFKMQQNEIIENCSFNEFKKPQGYLTFCLTRDPIKRFLSAYSNRIKFHKDLDMSKTEGKRVIRAGLLANPQLDYLIDHLDEYIGVKGKFCHHAFPMSDFVGKDLSVYDHIFDLSQMGAMKDILVDHWKKHGIALAERLPAIPRAQTGGQKLGLEILSPKHFDKLMHYYREDYDKLPMMDRNAVRMEWERARAAFEVANLDHETGELVIKQKKSKIVDVHRLPEISLAPDKSGEIMPFKGAILLSSKANGRYRLIFSDARGEGILKWKLPSPKLRDKFPGNQYSTHACYKATGLHIVVGKNIKIMLENAAGEREIILKVSLKKEGNI